jgi:hypothetical protein
VLDLCGYLVRFSVERDSVLYGSLNGDLGFFVGLLFSLVFLSLVLASGCFTFKLNLY